MTLSKEQIKFYHDNGYLILDDVYTSTYTINFLRSMRRHANADFAAIINPDREDELIKNEAVK